MRRNLILVLGFILILLTSGFYFSFLKKPKVFKKLPEKTMIKLTSPVFKDGQFIPKKYTCDGEDINPPLVIKRVPAGAKSLVLIVDDPDAPMGTWVHWVIWNIDPKITEIKEKTLPPNAIEGINDFAKHSYGGPCPPSGTHRYYFKLYALDILLSLSPTSGKKEVEKAMEGHILDFAQLIGLYQRK